MKLLLFLLFVSLSAQAKLKIALSPQCPYVCFNKDQRDKGYIVDILKDIFKDELELSFLPRLRLKNELSSGKSDFIVLSSSNIILNSRMVSTSPPLGMSLLGKVAIDSNLVKTPLYELRHKNIVLPKDQTSQQLVAFYRNKYPEWKTNKINFITGNNQESRMLKMLKLKRTDIVLSDYYSLTTILAKEKGTLFLRPTSYTGFTPIILVGLDKKNKMVYGKISKWLEENRKSGRINQFLKKYNIEDWNIYDTRF